MAEKIYFYCDESGAKGYADQKEAFPGEVGVFAGILVPEECHSSISDRFDSIANQFRPARGKLHIADLPNEKKRALRQAFFSEIQEANLPCFWYAIHVAGLHDYHVKQLEFLRFTKESIEARRANSTRIKTGSSRDNPSSMHVELFSGLYSRVVAFLLERDRAEVDLEIRTDQVDSPLAKKFKEVATELLRKEAQVTKKTGFDTATQEVVHGQIIVDIQYAADLEIPPVVRELRITPVDDSHGLVVAVDVLANSLNHLFKHRTDSELYAPLNVPEAVASHPLAPYLDAFYDWGEGDLVGDRLYRHPNVSVGN